MSSSSALEKQLWSSRFLEYVADLAPAGKVGAYMGLAGIPWFLAKMTTGPLFRQNARTFCAGKWSGKQRNDVADLCVDCLYQPDWPDSRSQMGEQRGAAEVVIILAPCNSMESREERSTKHAYCDRICDRPDARVRRLWRHRETDHRGICKRRIRRRG